MREVRARLQATQVSRPRLARPPGSDRDQQGGRPGPGSALRSRGSSWPRPGLVPVRPRSSRKQAIPWGPQGARAVPEAGVGAPASGRFLPAEREGTAATPPPGEGQPTSGPRPPGSAALRGPPGPRGMARRGSEGASQGRGRGLERQPGPFRMRRAGFPKAEGGGVAGARPGKAGLTGRRRPLRPPRAAPRSPRAAQPPPRAGRRGNGVGLGRLPAARGVGPGLCRRWRSLTLKSSLAAAPVTPEVLDGGPCLGRRPCSRRESPQGPGDTDGKWQGPDPGCRRAPARPLGP